MHGFVKKWLMGVALFIVALALWPADGVAVISTFDADLDGWTGSGATISWENSGGNPGGALKSVDIQVNWAQIIAPSKFLGTWASTGIVAADIKVASTSTDFLPAFAISDGNTSYEYVFSNPASTTWQTFSVSLNDSGWSKLTNDSYWYLWSPPIGNHTLAQVLQNVQTFRIRTDLVNGLGDIDTTFVDNISASLVPLPSALLLLGAALARFGRRLG